MFPKKNSGPLFSKLAKAEKALSYLKEESRPIIRQQIRLRLAFAKILRKQRIKE